MMKRILGRMSSLLVLGAIALAASTAQAVLPSWDEKLPAATRFVVLTDWNSQAVLDRETGLVWEKSPNTVAEANWYDAKYSCVNRSVGGRKAWRLPSFPELASLVDTSLVNHLFSAPGAPKLPVGHPFKNVHAAPYWSATVEGEGVGDWAWFVDFSDGDVDTAHKRRDTRLSDWKAFLWCVRGAMNSDQH